MLSCSHWGQALPPRLPSQTDLPLPYDCPFRLKSAFPLSPSGPCPKAPQPPADSVHRGSVSTAICHVRDWAPCPLGPCILESVFVCLFLAGSLYLWNLCLPCVYSHPWLNLTCYCFWLSPFSVFGFYGGGAGGGNTGGTDCLRVNRSSSPGLYTASMDVKQYHTISPEIMKPTTKGHYGEKIPY